MCGMCGFIDFNSNTNIQVLDEMTSALNHRGPDDSGTIIYKQKNATIGLGHTRLSILDLSSLGHQPMEFENYSIVYNGEIYNFKEIKTELLSLGHKFLSDSDTEVILHSFKEWGIKSVSKFIGMFAFVIFDKIENKITIVRDRAGVKPLYYYWNNDLFMFSSELKTFDKHPKFEKKLDISSVHQYMDFGYVPSPYCIFEKCHKLQSGHILNFNINTKQIKLIKYWDVTDYYKMDKLDISYDDAKVELESLLKSACEYRMVSDVPVGVFLSGGFDSTAVTALLQHNRKDKLKTFTIGFKESKDDYLISNEAPFAKDIARHLGTDHTEYYCSTKEAQEIIPKLSYFYDEPFGDSSAIPTTLVSRIAKKHVTVALSADGGDEIFAGYTVYRIFLKNLSLIKKIPIFSRKVVINIISLLDFFIPKNSYNLKNKFKDLSKILNTDVNKIQQELFRKYFKLSDQQKKDLFIKPLEKRSTIFDYNFTNFKDDLSIPLCIDYAMYLENDILTKVDRSTMSVSLEGREPFIDHRIIEFAARLPMKFKYGNTQKKILKDIVYKYVPSQLMDRPKTGFSIPINKWLKTDLKYLIDLNLDKSSIERTEVFNVSAVENLKNDFFNGLLDHSDIIWKILQFQLWHKKWM
jgi:asparagine synthase (glutamine-hydrolysing)